MRSLDIEEGLDLVGKKRKNDGDEERPKKVIFDGRVYEMDEDGRLVDYFEFDIPLINRKCKINVCDFFKYLFGK